MRIHERKVDVLFFVGHLETSVAESTIDLRIETREWCVNSGLFDVQHRCSIENNFRKKETTKHYLIKIFNSIFAVFLKIIVAH